MAAAQLLLVYLLALCKPFCPSVQYMLNKAYIAQTLCENKNKPELQCEGKCHLAKEITKANDAGEKESKPVSPRITFDNDFSCLNPAADLENLLQNPSSQFKLDPAVPFTAAVIADFFHPPRHLFTLR
ncbi:MAG: hypothetical protein ONB41_02270 [candidate division KSB1 bacterium]|nr:hypothetical protein [candidate division KSB1 bacterium]